MFFKLSCYWWPYYILCLDWNNWWFRPWWSRYLGGKDWALCWHTVWKGLLCFCKVQCGGGSNSVCRDLDGGRHKSNTDPSNQCRLVAGKVLVHLLGAIKRSTTKPLNAWNTNYVAAPFGASSPQVLFQIYFFENRTVSAVTFVFLLVLTVLYVCMYNWIILLFLSSHLMLWYWGR